MQHVLSVSFLVATSWDWDEDLMGVTSEVHLLRSCSGLDASGVYARLELGLAG